MNIHPTQLSISDEGDLNIQWNDGVHHSIPLQVLRKACPCASCREKMQNEVNSTPELLPVLAVEETRPLKIQAMRTVGNYAYAIAFSDGHDTGIYTIEFLRALGDEDAEWQDLSGEAQPGREPRAASASAVVGRWYILLQQQRDILGAV